jgi:hypothetical protein
MKLYLPDVTLISYASGSTYVDRTIFALCKSYQDINFEAVKLLSDIKPDNLPKEITWEYAPKIDHINDYNLYIFKYLGTHVDTSHCLLIQHDSWVLNADLWDDGWLQWDYCGAPWKIMDNAYISWGSKEHVRVGNGGFSLRSKKLLDIPLIHDLPLLQEQSFFNEDGVINCYYRELMIALGIKYAPVEVAAKFAYENDVQENFNIEKFFGFHKNEPVRDI